MATTQELLQRKQELLRQQRDVLMQKKLSTQLAQQGGGALAGVQASQGGEFNQQDMLEQQRQSFLNPPVVKLGEKAREIQTESVLSQAKRVGELQQQVGQGEVTAGQAATETVGGLLKTGSEILFSPIIAALEEPFEAGVEKVGGGIDSMARIYNEKLAEQGVISPEEVETQTQQMSEGMKSSLMQPLADFKKVYDESDPQTQSKLKTALNFGQVALDVLGGFGGSKVAKKAGVEALEQAPKVVGAIETGIAKTGDIVGTGIQKGKEFVEPILEKRNARIVEQTKQQVDEVAGKIVQGATKDKDKAVRALLDIDTEDVKSYGELKEAITSKEAALSDELGTFLDEQGKVLKLDELKKVTDVDGVPVEQNFVDDALNHLEELYGKSDKVSEQRIINLRNKAEAEGLTLREINDLSKEYGMEFKNKAFTKVGEPRTSVSAPMYENTRKGIKEAVRSNIEGDVAKAIDSKLSDLINTRQLVDKMDEAVNKLKQKIQKRSLGAKIGAKLVDIADALTLGGLKGAIARALPRGVGFKTLNALDLEEQLTKNLDLIKKLDNLLEKKSVNIKDLDAFPSEATPNKVPLKSNKTDAKFKRTNAPNDVIRERMTTEEAAKIVRKYFTEDEVSLVFAERIALPDGQEAYGMYKDRMISMVKNPEGYTPDHESFHAFGELFARPKDFRSLLDETKTRKKLKTDLDAEEFLAEEFAKYAVGIREASWTGKMKSFFATVWNDMKSVFGKEDKAQKMFDDLISGERPANNIPKGEAKFKAGTSLEQEARKYKSAEATPNKVPTAQPSASEYTEKLLAPNETPDFKKIINNHKNKTLIIDSDEFKKSYQGFTGKNAPEFHERSSADAKALYNEALKNPRFKTVEIIGGGSGSGKSETYVKNAGNKPDTIIFDGTMSSPDSTRKKIQQAIDAGKTPKIVGVISDPMDAFKFIRVRAKKTGRVVPVDIFKSTHKGFRDTINQMAQEFKDLEITTILNIGAKDAKKPSFSFSGDRAKSFLEDFKLTEQQIDEVIKTGE